MVRYYFGQNVGFVNNLVAKKAETSIFNYKIWIRRKDMFIIPISFIVLKREIDQLNQKT